MEKGFFASLFDISFDSLITTRIIKILYVLILIVIGLFTLFFIIAGFASGAGRGVGTLIFAPLIALLYVIYARVFLEVLIVLFKIGENTAELVRLQGGGAGTGGLTAGAPVTQGLTGGAGAGAGAPAAGGGQQAAAAPSGGQAPGWYSDPQGQKRLRYWDGSSWTEHTSD
jgi:hypothetical protein